MATYASMYGPYRQVVDVGPHTASSTTITLECGHQTTIVPHMSAQGMVGDSTPCVACKADAESAMVRYEMSGRCRTCQAFGHFDCAPEEDPRCRYCGTAAEYADAIAHRHCPGDGFAPRTSPAPIPEDDGFLRCESGWTGDRCYFRLGHEGPHSND